MRRGVTTETNLATGRTVARCTRLDCGWTYSNPVKAAAAEEARWHRQKHRQQDARTTTEEHR